MNHSYAPVNLHILIAAKYRSVILDSTCRSELYSRITNTVEGHGQKMIAIGGVSDHVHMLISVENAPGLSDLMRLIKSNSAKWIAETNCGDDVFQWEAGYAAFKISRVDLPVVIEYIHDQLQYDASRSFFEVYMELLERNSSHYTREYLFHERRYAKLERAI